MEQPSKRKVYCIVITILIIILYGCGRSQEDDMLITSLRNQVNNLEQKNRLLQDEVDSNKQKISKLYNEMPTLDETIQNALTSHGFIELKYEIRHYSNNQTLIRTESLIKYSSVMSIPFLNEDTKYKLLDEAEQQLRSGIREGYIKVTDRELFNYPSYAEASRALEEKKKKMY